MYQQSGSKPVTAEAGYGVNYHPSILPAAYSSGWFPWNSADLQIQYPLGFSL